MKERVSCSYDAYRKLESSGVLKRVNEKYEDVSSFFLYENLLTDEAGKDVWNWANSVYFDRGRGINEESVAAHDVLKLAEELGDVDFRVDDFLFYKHPSFLGKFVLGEDVDYRSKGFGSLNEMYKAVSAYCVEGRFEIGRMNRDNYVWRNERNKNKIYLNVHGDFFVSQDDISSNLEKTLFGEKFDVGKVCEFNNGFASYQDSSNFLLATLRYAEYLGMVNIPEIQEWEKTLDDVGSIGTATTECLMGGGRLNSFFFERGLPFEGEEARVYPITFNGMANNYFTIPFISKEGDFCVKGYDYETMITGDDVRVRFGPGDVSEMLKGTYRLFTRDKSLLPQVMKGFLGR